MPRLDRGIQGGRATARKDPDNAPITVEEWEAGLRRQAERYRIPLSTLRQWEQGTREPDGAARLLLELTEQRPDLVAAVAEGRLTIPGAWAPRP